MIENQDKKYLLSDDSQLNADDSPFAVSPNSWCNAENIRTKSTDKGVTGTVESIGGTLLLSQPQPSITFITIGSVADRQNNRIIYFKCCTTGPWDKIVCYDFTTNQEYDVLLSSQVNGYLGFSKRFLIHSAKVENGLLYWTDNINEPRRMNIDAGIKMNNSSYVTDQEPYVAPLEQWVITLIRRSAYYPLIVQKLIDAGYTNNFIQNEATQYAVRYIFRDYEYSVIGPYSVLIPYNSIGQIQNYVNIAMPLDEYIDQDIIEVELIVRFGNTGNPFVIHTWDRDDIDAHDSGTALSFDFYNDITGSPIDQVAANKPFESIPLLALTAELVKNRYFLANMTEGYDSPTDSSLVTSVATAEDGGDVIGVWQTIQRTYYTPAATNITDWVLYVSSLSPAYYYFSAVVYPATPPDPILVSSANYSTDNVGDMAAYVASTHAYPADTYWTIFPTTTTSEISGGVVSLDGARAFKSDGTYQVAIWFFDKYRRKCGVVYKEVNKVKMPERSFDQTVYNVGIDWLLSNDLATDEIPEWAYYYTVGRTKCLSTSFFLQARSANTCYVEKDDDGVYTFNTSDTPYLDTYYGVGIDISPSIGFGMGYSFQDGDLVGLYFETGLSGKQEFSILAQDGKWLILNLANMGNLGGTVKPLYEIFTPFKARLNEFFYEIGNIYIINNPATGNRQYSTTSGTLNGDVYLVKRLTEYFTENMSPNDKYWQNWQTDIGWANVIDKIGQKYLPDKIAFSDVYLQGTKVNGLSSFGALNVENLDADNGSIQKLQLTQKVQVDGTVMLAICENETISCYLGEQELYDTQGSAFVASATTVIGTTKALRGSRGTENPESVIEYRGNVFFGDAKNGRWVQYSSNGLDDISSYKMVRFWKQFFLQYNSMTYEQIEALGSRPFIFSTIDSSHDELLITIPKLLESPPKGYMPDYPEMIFPFDIWDGQAKTIVYKLAFGEGRPYWIGAYRFTPENLISFKNSLYTFKYGHLYLHNQTLNFNEFYGIQYSSKIMVVSNALPNKPKQYDNVASESNLAPSFLYMYNNFPIQQSSDLVDEDFTEIEGGFFTTIKRNKLIPTAAGYTTDGLLTGEKMRNATMFMMWEWRVTTIPLELRFLNVGFSQSRGYNI